MIKWYLIKTKARQEKIAVSNLEAQNYKVYCPCSLINNKNVVLFPGYVFIQLDKDLQDWFPIRSTKGVINFVKFGLNFAKISDDLIKLIKKNELSTSEKIKNIDNFKVGNDVLITNGALRNRIAIFKSFKSSDRVILLMNLMGQDQAINFDKKSLVAL
jgi:transcriptional antiterminator RfaH